MVSILLYIRVTYSQKEKFPKSHDPNGLIDKKCYLTLADFSAFVTNAVNWLLMRQNSVHVFLQPICQQKAERKRKLRKRVLCLYILFLPLSPLPLDWKWREKFILSLYFLFFLLSPFCLGFLSFSLVRSVSISCHFLFLSPFPLNLNLNLNLNL